MPQINLDDTALEYRECGSGPPLLMVHGSASDFRSWQSQMEPFGRHYRAIACSRRYHWPNPSIPPGITYTMNEQADDLRRVIQSIGDTPLHVVGHSYGAFLSLLAPKPKTKTGSGLRNSLENKALATISPKTGHEKSMTYS